MGNHTEFKRAVNLILENINVDANVNVSVFETNIRVVGGLLSAHILSGRVEGMQLHDGWPCSGPLLDLAVKFATKLLPAFNTETGMPYGTVNLKYGVNRFETPVTCTAGVGTFVIEFGALSRLTGDPHFEKIALNALDALYRARSGIGLVGNHINTETGLWTATDAGIGAGVDSYFEYLAKGGLLFHRPKLLQQFYDYEKAINKYIRQDDWFTWVSMTKGGVTFPIFQSLEAFWPGVLALIGKVDDATRILLTYFQINRQFGVTPEFYNLQNHETSNQRAGYPLRPEMVESMLYLYKATKDPTYLHEAAAMVEAIEHGTKTKCGYATIKDVNDYTLEDRMESFFLAETTKYLYLLFDEENFMHNDGTTSRIIDTPNGKCVIEAGGYIFNTEAHPIDPAMLYCCSSKKAEDITKLQKFEDNIDFISLLDLRDPHFQGMDKDLDKEDLSLEVNELDVGEEQMSPEIESEIEELERQWDQTDNIQVPLATPSSESNIQVPLATTTPTSEPNIQVPIPPPPTTTPTPTPDTTIQEPPISPTTPLSGVNADTPILLIDLKSSTSKTELQERVKVNKEVIELITNAKEHDKKQHAAGDLRSNLAGEILQYLIDIRNEYSNLLKISAKLETPTMENIKVQLAKRKYVQEQPGIEILDENICVPIERSSDSLALKRMLNIIYSKHILKRHQIRFIHGPICRPKDAPPKIEEMYFTNKPAIFGIEKAKLPKLCFRDFPGTRQPYTSNIER
uniref:alpha-1,2-Mannosidase n=1 Tax=Panagrolaimus davidi TaxID=227884 RepID=A0A914R1M7_9BILA